MKSFKKTIKKISIVGLILMMFVGLAALHQIYKVCAPVKIWIYSTAENRILISNPMVVWYTDQEAVWPHIDEGGSNMELFEMISEKLQIPLNPGNKKIII